MFHKEGYKIITVTFIITIALALLTDHFIDIAWLKYLCFATIGIFLFLILQFFRNPKRNTVLDNDTVVSPVDGKVVVIEEVYEPEFFKDKRIQVSVFMSPINVHVCRYPLGGKVAYSKYHPGKYLVAWHPKASTENERTSVVVDNTTFGKVLFRQIAGALAKRIVNYAEVGQEATMGTDQGFIKFGSRVDVYFPLGTDIKVALNQTVKGGEDILAVAK